MRQLSETTMYYAYKEGKHVWVLQRDVVTGDEQVILEYDEPHEAKQDGNYWDELNPSIALDPEGRHLIYASDPNLVSRDLGTGVSTPLLSGQTPDSLGRRHWLSSSAQELCCGYLLALVSVGPGGRALVEMAQYEGSILASFSTGGSEVCKADVSGPNSLTEIAWNRDGDAVWASPEGQAEGGLFVIHSGQPCHAEELARDLEGTNSGFDDASWSPSGDLIVVGERLGAYQSNENLLIVSADGANRRTLVEGGANHAPIFSLAGDSVYYSRFDATGDDGHVSKSSVWSVDVASQQQRRLFELPEGWIARPGGWTAEGYLMLRLTHGCDFYLSCGSRLALIDPSDGALVYLSAQRDFTNFLGFVP